MHKVAPFAETADVAMDIDFPVSSAPQFPMNAAVQAVADAGPVGDGIYGLPA